MAADKLPSKMKQIMVTVKGTDFRKATEIVESDVPQPGPNEILVKNKYVGINATDINFIAGRYDPTINCPFPCGLEGMGVVVKAGADSPIKEGQTVVYLGVGSFAEYVVRPAATSVPVPSDDPALMSIVLSGLTASISLEKEADLKPEKTVLVTAAAGGTGQFAVQIAKAAGCHVIGTCSTPEKVEFLKGIGCDRPINYRKEDLGEVLSKEYPKGIDVVYECIGKEVFDAAIQNLAVKGRIIVIGMITGYKDGIETATNVATNIPFKLLGKSASVRGFYLPHYATDYARHVGTLTKMYVEKKLKINVDKGSGKPFTGLTGVADGIDHMYAGKNIGKVVVTLE